MNAGKYWAEMTVFFPILYFLFLLALSIVVTLIVPDYAGWPQSVVALASFSIFLLAVLLFVLSSKRGIDRRFRGIERSVARIARETDKLGLDVSALRQIEGNASGSTEDMIREMRVLQTLLGQIIGRSGTGLRKDDVNVEGLLQGVAVTQAARAELSPDIEADILSVVQGALSENRVDLYLQPTVALPSRRPQHYECFSRVRGLHDEVIYPQQYLPVAESSGLVGTLDNLLLFRCIQLVRKLGPRRLMCTFFAIFPQPLFLMKSSFRNSLILWRQIRNWRTGWCSSFLKPICCPWMNGRVTV
ncbi:hypothetical protein JCM17843_25610 [Kordiimonadales bacterium JCM 17843]|nr:hypothetical protein JCM17843_25610 [Kordiimonadales bacterium JCM 17843]